MCITIHTHTHMHTHVFSTKTFTHTDIINYVIIWPCKEETIQQIQNKLSHMNTNHLRKGFPKWKLSPANNACITCCGSGPLGRSCIREFLSFSERWLCQTCNKFQTKWIEHNLRIEEHFVYHETMGTSCERTSVKSSNSKISWGIAKTSAMVLWCSGTEPLNGLKSLRLTPICSLLATTLFWLPSHWREIWAFIFDSLCGNPRFFLFTLCWSLELEPIMLAPCKRFLRWSAAIGTDVKKIHSRNLHQQIVKYCLHHL